MANTPLTVVADLTGLSSPTLNLYVAASGAIVNGSGDTLTQVSGREFQWECTVTEALTGVHYYEVVASGIVIDGGYVLLADTTDRCYGAGSYADAVNSGGVGGGGGGGDATLAKQNEILAKFTGITSMAHWLRLLGRSDAPDDTAKAEFNDGGGTYNEGQHSQQAIGVGTTALNSKIINTYINVLSHHRPDGSIVIVRGDDHKVANTRFLFWKNADGTGWPTSLTGETVAVNFAAVHKEYEGTATGDVPATHKIIGTGSVFKPDAPDQEVRVELSAAQTDVAEGLYNYDVEIVMDGNTSTLVTTAEPGLTGPRFTNAETRPMLEVLPHYAQPS